MESSTLPAKGGGPAELIVRSSVPAGLKYREYVPYLRYDFYGSCAYCTITEVEAGGIRFTVDHYEPRSIRPDLEHDYGNLMYACDACNTYKGNRSPPDAARHAGHRFFRPDYDVVSEHFVVNGRRIEGITETGRFTVTFLSLNRLALQRLRAIRERLRICDREILEGVRGLRSLPLDQLKLGIKQQALRVIHEIERAQVDLREDVDALLRSSAMSALLDQDGAAPRLTEERAAEATRLGALFPGRWRG